MKDMPSNAILLSAWVCIVILCLINFNWMALFLLTVALIFGKLISELVTKYVDGRENEKQAQRS